MKNCLTVDYVSFKRNKLDIKQALEKISDLLRSYNNQTKTPPNRSRMFFKSKGFNKCTTSQTKGRVLTIFFFFLPF